MSQGAVRGAPRWSVAGHSAAATMSTAGPPLRAMVLVGPPLAFKEPSDASNVSEWFAVRAEDTVGATDNAPRLLRLNPEMLTPGTQPAHSVRAGTATLIATGGMVPRGADAVIMVEHTDVTEVASAGLDVMVEIRRAIVPGQFVAGHRTFRQAHKNRVSERHFDPSTLP